MVHGEQHPDVTNYHQISNFSYPSAEDTSLHWSLIRNEIRIMRSSIEIEVSLACQNILLHYVHGWWLVQK